MPSNGSCYLHFLPTLAQLLFCCQLSTWNGDLIMSLPCLQPFRDSLLVGWSTRLSLVFMRPFTVWLQLGLSFPSSASSQDSPRSLLHLPPLPSAPIKVVISAPNVPLSLLFLLQQTPNHLPRQPSLVHVTPPVALLLPSPIFKYMLFVLLCAAVDNNNGDFC